MLALLSKLLTSLIGLFYFNLKSSIETDAIPAIDF